MQEGEYYLDLKQGEKKPDILATNQGSQQGEAHFTESC